MVITIKISKDNKRRAQVDKAIKILNGVQSYFFYKLCYEDVDIPCTTKINWQNYCEDHEKEEKEIVITEKAFDDNWFSHEEAEYAVITTSDWEEVFAPPSLGAYLVYQIAQASINFTADIREEMALRLVHDRAEGCLFDFCGHKTDIKLGMVSGTICPQCRGVLVRYGVPEKALDAVERILLYVRSEAIGKPLLFNEKEAFIVMRFSSNDENDHAFKYGIMPALHKLNIIGTRADNQITSSPILQKIRQLIERSRFVIVKVDTNNLNVYYELGLAMGLDKEILLICDESLVIDLPTDIKNLECLTYPKGNYEVLESKILQFFESNYHFRIVGGSC